MKKIVNEKSWINKYPNPFSINPNKIINIEAFEGHYETWSDINLDDIDNLWIKNLINKGIIIIYEHNKCDNVYYHPFVCISFKDDNVVTIYFNKYNEALEYFNHLTEKIKFLNLSFI